MTAPAIEHRPSQEEVDRNMANVRKRRVADAIMALRDDPDYRILKRISFEPFRHEPPADAKVYSGLYLDVEATGLDVASDRIIEFAAVPFKYTKDGLIFEVQRGYVGREDPGIPLTPEVMALTGICDDDLKGRRLDDEVILSVAASSDIIIAHHADYDRKMVERRFEASPFADRPWACSFSDVPWHDLTGLRTAKLDYLLAFVCNAFHDAHGADTDCHAALHILRTAAPDGRSFFEYLLRSARTPKSRVWAVGAPFEVKDQLKRRGYRWNSGDDGRLKAWWKDIDDAVLDEEREWLRAEARCPNPRVIVVKAYDRYSVRA